MAVIDIGSAAINRGTVWSSGFTTLDKTNPANATGVITSVDFWFNTNATGVRVGTFYLISGTTYQLRDSELIGNVTAGSKQTKTVNLDVVTGDLIGFYSATGNFEADTSGGSGVLYFSGDFPAGNTNYTLFNSSESVSVYGLGATVDTNTTNFFQFF